MKTFRDLLIWQKAMALVIVTYEKTKQFPQSENYGLTSQLRRCAISIPSNIAEGYGRDTQKEFARFLSIAIGSLYEFQTQIEIAKNINYLNITEFNLLYENSRELEIMMKSFTRKLAASK
jgi:four helix bundle protein